MDIEFETFYPVPRDPNDYPEYPAQILYAMDVRARVEPGSATEDDLLVDAVPVGDWTSLLGTGTTWLAVQALADGIAEGSETLVLRLAPEPRPNVYARFHYPPAVELRNAELEVVIHDREPAAVCATAQITATPPRNLTLPLHLRRRCSLWGAIETEVTLEVDRGQDLQWDRIVPYGRVHGWRIEPMGSRIRHELVVQWWTEESWEMRLQPCPESGRGPTLVCTVDRCETYPAGAAIPPPRIPAGCR